MSDILTTNDTSSQTEYHLHGQPITARMQTSDWFGTLFFALLGRDPKPQERELLSAACIAVIDHGEAPPSAHVTRVVASCGKPVAESVAAGLLTLGPRHGNAASLAARWLQEQKTAGLSSEEAVKQALASGKRVAGFGHPEYERDPRAVALLQMAQKTLPNVRYGEYARAIGEELTRQKGKSLYLNIDGAIAALILDLELPVELADVFFLLARTVGLCAHALEEASLAKNYRRESAK